LFVAAFWSTRVFGGVFKNLMKRGDVLFTQGTGNAPHRERRRNFVFGDPAAVGILVEIVARLTARRAHIGGIEAARRGLGKRRPAKSRGCDKRDQWAQVEI